MDAISYEYTRPRRQFGLHQTFTDGPDILESIDVANEEDIIEKEQTYRTEDSLLQNEQVDDNVLGDNEDRLNGIPAPITSSKPSQQWVGALSTTTDIDCIPARSAHAVNTERFVQQAKGTLHTDGAWPAEVKTNEPVDRQRYVRRIINEPSYQTSVAGLSRTAEQVALQNNAVDLYEEYFSNNDLETFQSAPPSAKTVCIFRDPSTSSSNAYSSSRACTRISWHPDGANKLAAVYNCTGFQKMPSDMSFASYIWDVTSPNTPDATLLPLSPLTAIAYNPRSPDQLVGGCYNGLLAFFDLRKGMKSVDHSLLEKSHFDPVNDVYWVQSRTGNECVSVSTDGQLLWWDIRNLKRGYTDSMWLSNDDLRLGGTSMEYRSDAGATRFLVGTEQGSAVLCDRKAKKDSESQKSIKSTFGSPSGGHLGPIVTITRNPFNVKYFLTIGDWSAKVWMEDLRSPLISTYYHNAYLTSGCWSPTRPAVFYTSKSDGTMDVWDLYHKQQAPIYTLKVSEAEQGLTCLRVHSNGRHIAIGDGNGACTVVSVNSGLVEMQREEKTVMSALLERETKREKNLEVRLLQRKRDAGKDKNEKRAELRNEEDSAETKEAIQQAEEQFFEILKTSANGNSASSQKPDEEVKEPEVVSNSDEKTKD